INTDTDYASVYELGVIAGTFDTSDGHVVNESALKLLGFQNPNDAIGASFKDRRGYSRKITGVVKDYHHHSLHGAIRPSMFISNDASYKLDTFYSVKLKTSNMKDVMEKVEEAFKRAYPNDEFSAYFIDSYFDAQYQADIQFGNLFTIFSGLAVFIACLGIFGLTVHTVHLKTKEIGIRKVLGASVKNVTLFLTTSTMKWVMIGSFLAFPLSYWLSKYWLSNYAVRVRVDWLFMLPILIVPMIVLVTMSTQTIKAALSNPVDSLRDE
ncbi:MAG: FtsX-like permease family protein, partial [Bacteroidota bacterium]